MTPIVSVGFQRFEAFADRGEERAAGLEHFGQGVEAGFGQMAERSIIFGDQDFLVIDIAAVASAKQDAPAVEIIEEHQPMLTRRRGSLALRRLLAGALCGFQNRLGRVIECLSHCRFLSIEPTQP